MPSGCIMGLIGENGAGKSTTIKLILDMLHKDSGTIEILGRDNQDNLQLIKEDIGVVLDEVGIPECLTAKQVGKVMKYTFRNWNSEKYAELLKMKLGFAVALSHESKLLLLDEATSGLDPVIRDEIVEMLYDFTREENHSILISSHIVSDLEKLCDYVAFLHKGKLILCEEKDRLLDEYGIIHCTAEQLKDYDSSAIKYKKETPYGIEAIVLRDAVPKNTYVSPISIEELFVITVKETK